MHMYDAVAETFVTMAKTLTKTGTKTNIFQRQRHISPSHLYEAAGKTFCDDRLSSLTTSNLVNKLLTLLKGTLDEL